jgi:hypothetical protein
MHMARKPQTTNAPRSGKVPRTGFEKMQMSHARMRKDIARNHAESAERNSTGKPVHPPQAYRR